jgi:hypothetical protein
VRHDRATEIVAGDSGSSRDRGQLGCRARLVAWDNHNSRVRRLDFDSRSNVVPRVRNSIMNQL